VTSTNDILDQIDTALGDYSVSDDAMRSRPASEADPGQIEQPLQFHGTVPVVQIMDEANGEWQTVEGVEAIEVCIESPAIDPEFARRWQELSDYLQRVQLERARRAQEILAAIRQAFRQMAPAVEEAARNVTAAAEAVQKAPPRRDRPAWQSPYGPARRRR